MNCGAVQMSHIPDLSTLIISHSFHSGSFYAVWVLRSMEGHDVIQIMPTLHRTLSMIGLYACPSLTMACQFLTLCPNGKRSCCLKKDATKGSCSCRKALRCGPIDKRKMWGLRPPPTLCQIPVPFWQRTVIRKQQICRGHNCIQFQVG